MANPALPPRLSVPKAAQLFNLLSDEDRLRLVLHLTRHGETSVKDLCATLGASPAVMSNRLKLLRLGGVVRLRREGKTHLYCLDSPEVRHLLGLLDGGKAGRRG
jgi:DNA-binding transcriptional ArsR family regulator